MQVSFETKEIMNMTARNFDKETYQQIGIKDT